MFDTAPTQTFVPRETLVAFKLTSMNQSLPDWFHRLVKKGMAKFDEGGHIRVQVITGKFWVVELGQVVVKKDNDYLYVMDEMDFNRLYKEA
jgi:hypothetical protein